MTAAPASRAGGGLGYIEPAPMFDDIPSTARLIAALEDAGLPPVPALNESDVVFTRRAGTAIVRSCAIATRPEWSVVKTGTVTIEAHPRPYKTAPDEQAVRPSDIGVSATYLALLRLNIMRLERQLAGEHIPGPVPPGPDATPAEAATHPLFAAFRAERAYNTRRVYDDALDLFAFYLAHASLRPRVVVDLGRQPTGWSEVDETDVAGFVGWLRGRYRENSVRMRLSAVKCYARVATAAGAVPPMTLSFIEQIKP